MKQENEQAEYKGQPPCTEDGLACFRISELPYLRVLGRTNGCLDPLTLFWTASGLEISVRAKELWVRVRADYEQFEPWLDIVVDGALMQRRMLAKGEQEICVFRQMEPDRVRTVRILRDTPAMPQDEWTLLQILSVRTDGSFCPAPEYAMRLEFIGDSITSGEGGAGAVGEMTWNSGCFDCVNHYTFWTAEALNAEYQVISQSGWGVYCSWQGRREQAIPPYYEQVCGLLCGEQNRSLGAMEPWNFARWQPDVVIVNLGTNDAGSFSFGGVTDPLTGFVGPMRSNSDGSMYEEDRQAIEDAAYQFLKQLRRCHPDSYILWCYGMMGDALAETLRHAVSRCKTESGDTRMEYFPLPDTPKEQLGSREHPGHEAHRHVSELLAEKIRALLPSGFSCILHESTSRDSGCGE